MGMGMVQTFFHGDVRVPAQDLPLAIVQSLGGYPRSSTGVGTDYGWRELGWIPDRLNSEFLPRKIFSGCKTPTSRYVVLVGEQAQSG